MKQSERARSYQLRFQALEFEEEAEWDQALELYKRAAQIQEPWDPKDHKLLLACIKRVQDKQYNARRD